MMIPQLTFGTNDTRTIVGDRVLRGNAGDGMDQPLLYQFPRTHFILYFPKYAAHMTDVFTDAIKTSDFYEKPVLLEWNRSPVLVTSEDTHETVEAKVAETKRVFPHLDRFA